MPAPGPSLLLPQSGKGPGHDPRFPKGFWEALGPGPRGESSSCAWSCTPGVTQPPPRLSCHLRAGGTHLSQSSPTSAAASLSPHVGLAGLETHCLPLAQTRHLSLWHLLFPPAPHLTEASLQTLHGPSHFFQPLSLPTCLWASALAFPRLCTSHAVLGLPLVASLPCSHPSSHFPCDW